MPVLMISETIGQTERGYELLLASLEEQLRCAPGFRMHSSQPTESGWRVIEVWDSREDAGKFFANHIAPVLPDGIRPKLSFEPLHDVLVS